MPTSQDDADGLDAGKRAGTQKPWRTRVTFFALGAVVGAVTLAGADAAGLVFGELKIMNSTPSYAFDIYDDQELMDFASHVFVGRVVEKSGTESRGSAEAQFRVEVLDVVKGELPAEVTVNQQGGYVPFFNQLELFDGDWPLLPGTTYLFSTRHSEQMGWYTLVPRVGNIDVRRLQHEGRFGEDLAAEVERRRALVASE
jgi:hypothetical protein